MFRLIWTAPGMPDRVSEPLDRAEALRQFAGLNAIRSACHPHSGRRLRIVEG